MGGEVVTRPVVLPDLDRDLTTALGDLEELLLILRWQEEGDPGHLVDHPPALAGGVALQALRRVADTVGPTQTDPDVTGGPRVLGPDGRYEHAPLRFVRLRAADLDALSAAAAALGEPVRSAGGHRRPADARSRKKPPTSGPCPA